MLKIPLNIHVQTVSYWVHTDCQLWCMLKYGSDFWITYVLKTILTVEEICPFSFLDPVASAGDGTTESGVNDSDDDLGKFVY